MNLARFSVRNKVTANILMIAVVVGGIAGAVSLRRELFPNVDPEAIVVTVRYPGATPEEVERLVARRIEREVAGVEDLDEVVSNVFEGLVAVTWIANVSDAEHPAPHVDSYLRARYPGDSARIIAAVEDIAAAHVASRPETQQESEASDD